MHNHNFDQTINSFTLFIRLKFYNNWKSKYFRNNYSFHRSHLQGSTALLNSWRRDRL